MGGLIAKAVMKTGADKLTKEVPPNFFDFKVKDIDGNVVDFAKYKDRKLIMVVNVACKWGLTSANYKGMVKMHNDLHSKGFEILAFPCNQFFNQENENEATIKKFVKENFNAGFPIFEKIEVNGQNTHPLYIYMRNRS